MYVWGCRVEEVAFAWLLALAHSHPSFPDASQLHAPHITATAAGCLLAPTPQRIPKGAGGWYDGTVIFCICFSLWSLMARAVPVSRYCVGARQPGTDAATATPESMDRLLAIRYLQIIVAWDGWKNVVGALYCMLNNRSVRGVAPIKGGADDGRAVTPADRLATLTMYIKQQSASLLMLSTRYRPSAIAIPRRRQG